MTIVDGHIHWGQWKPEREGWPGASIDDISDALDRSGIHKAVLLPTDQADNEGLAAAIQAHGGDRYYLFAWLEPHNPDRTLRFLDEYGDQVHGLKIHPSLERVKVSDPAWTPFFEVAEKRRFPVIVHCGRWQEMASWKFCLEVGERHPEAQVIVAHMGGDIPTLQQDCARELASRDLPNVFLGTESIREYYSMRMALDLLGPNRILFGSDYPLGWPSAYLQVFEGTKPNEEERRRVLGENLIELIGQVRPA